MRWIGLTGGIASGKSTVSRLLRARGLPVVDADELAREVVRVGTEGHREVVARFGPDVVGDDGELDRKRLGALVFSDPNKRLTLEGIIHPRVRDLAQQRRGELEQAGHALAFYDVPLLFEKNMAAFFDETVAVVCRPETQLSRLLSRDGCADDEARRRIAAQLPMEEKRRRASYVIENEGSKEDLERAVETLLRKLTQNPQA